MADPDYWRDLAADFRTLVSPHGSTPYRRALEAHWHQTSGSGTPVHWTISEDSGKAQFEALARRAARGLPELTNASLLSSWLDALRDEFPSNLKGDGVDDTTGIRLHDVSGVLTDVCAKSAALCSILESQTLEREHAEKHGESDLLSPKIASRKSAPHDPTTRDSRLRAFAAEKQISIAAISRAAQVHKANMQQWRRGELSDSSVMSERIEAVLNGKTPIG